MFSDESHKLETYTYVSMHVRTKKNEINPKKYKSLRGPTHLKIFLSLFGPTMKSFIYIYILWRGNMTPSYIRWVVREGGVACQPVADYSGKQESADYSSKQNSGSGRAVSLQPSLLAMYASAAERQTCDHDWYWGRNCQKANTW